MVARIIGTVDMLEYSPFGLASCFPTSAPDQLGRDGFEERLNLGVIITIAFGAHGYCDAVFGDTLLAATRAALRATVCVMTAASGWLTQSHCHQLDC